MKRKITGIKVGIFVSVICLMAGPLFSEEMNLEGISYEANDPSASVAVINGEVLSVGSSIGEYRVTEILLDRVDLAHKETGEKRVVRISSASSAAKPAAKAVAKKQVGGKRDLKEDEELLLKHANFWDSIKTYVEGMTSSFGGPMGTYKEFAELMFNGKFDQAREKVEGSSAKNLLASKQKSFEGCRASYGNNLSHTSFTLVSQKDLGDGQVELEVDQVARGDPPGVLSAFGSTMVAFKHKAVMVKTDQGWKVKSFQLHSVPNKNYPIPWLCFE